MKYEKLIEEIISSVGGAGNITSASHCFTRLRLTFGDREKVNEAQITSIDGVMGVNERGNEYQIIIGNKVGDVFREFQQVTGAGGTAETGAGTQKNVKFIDKVIDIIVGIFVPIIGLIAASGTLKGLLAVLAQFDLVSTDAGAYVILYAAADAIFYFFPVMVGFTAGKKFGANPYLTGLIGAILIYPSLVTALSEGTSLSFIGIPVMLVTYSSTVLPSIFGAWLASVVQRFFEKVLPDVLRMIFVPFFVLLITVPVVLLGVGPLATGISNVLSSGLESIYSVSPILAGLIFGGVWQVVILLGLAWGFVPVLITYLTKFGYDPIYGLLVPATLGQAGATLAVALKTKTNKTKSLALSTGLSCVLGVSEPAMYGITIPSKKPFIFGCAGGALGGAVAGLMQVKMFAPGLSGIFNLAGYFGTDNIQQNFIGGAVSLAVAFVAGFVLTYLFGWSDEAFEQEMQTAEDNG